MSVISLDEARERYPRVTIRPITEEERANLHLLPTKALVAACGGCGKLQSYAGLGTKLTYHQGRNYFTWGCCGWKGNLGEVKTGVWDGAPANPYPEDELEAMLDWLAGCYAVNGRYVGGTRSCCS